MKALILGGNRFFGKKLGELLLAEGHSLTLLNRGNLEDKLGAGVERLEADRRNSSQLRDALKQGEWDVVFDQICFNDKEAAEALKVFSGRVGRYIFTSSQSVYAPGEKISETSFDPRAHTFDSAAEFDYAEGKRRAEAVFFSQTSLPISAVRFPIVTGPQDPTGRLLFHLARIYEGLPIYFPSLTARLSLIHESDAAAALRFLATASFSGPINVAAKQPLRLSDLVSLLEKTLDRRAELIPSGSEAEHAPYGISADWFMDTARINDLGFHAREVIDWLPGLVRELRDSLTVS